MSTHINGLAQSAPPLTSFKSSPGIGLVESIFLPPGTSIDKVYDLIEWERRDAVIKNPVTGTMVFEQRNIEVPKSWSDTALKIVAQKYFKGPLGSDKRETSVWQMVCRVVFAIGKWGIEDGYFTPVEAQTYAAELAYLLVNQMGCFNSPVWFNVGTEFATDPEHPQCSACFINSVEDRIDGPLGISDWVSREARIFKDGSGSGVNLYKLRSKFESLSSGGKPSGVVSFMKTADKSAGQIKSGGKTRRAAKMVILNVDHGDIEEFIKSKAKAEKVAHDLISLGYDSSFDNADGAYGLVDFQNANHSVRVDDAFMAAVVSDRPYWTRKRSPLTGDLFGTGEVLHEYQARDLFRMMAQAAWECGDPGLQYHDTINRWNPINDTKTIWASNPCSEYMFLDDSACNLASLNLMKFVSKHGDFESKKFRSAIRVIGLAMEIFVDRAGYPTELIAQNSYDYRPLGLGFANLGGLLMTSGMAYDSDEGRAYAAAITSVMGASMSELSADIAAVKGPFAFWDQNRESGLRVLRQHHEASISAVSLMSNILTYSQSLWAKACSKAVQFGLRNGQVTVLAPTGTIGFMMDCATTGIEPETALVKYKTLVGGGQLKLVNPLVTQALESLGYSGDTMEAIVKHVEENGTVEGCDYIAEEDISIFDTSFPAYGRTRSIEPIGHVKMMSAVQPFLSGAISKTVNMPETATVKEIEDIYIKAWELGVKAIAIYRNNCKQSQPLSVKDESKKETLEELLAKVTPLNLHSETTWRPIQRKMPMERQAIVHEVVVAGQKLFITMGKFEDGSLGEIFIEGPKEGSTVSGLLRALSITTSMYLQFGGPLDKLVAKLAHMQFDPQGITSNPDLRFVKSPVDYIYRLLGMKFVDIEEESEGHPTSLEDMQQLHALPLEAAEPNAKDVKGTGFKKSEIPMKLCTNCGSEMKPSGTCWSCPGCGGTSGGCS